MVCQNQNKEKFMSGKKNRREEPLCLPLKNLARGEEMQCRIGGRLVKVTKSDFNKVARTDAPTVKYEVSPDQLVYPV